MRAKRGDSLHPRRWTACAVVLAGALLATVVPRTTVSGSDTSDAYVKRVRAELKVFTSWLAKNNVKGYMGEFGWPNNRSADQTKYNALAERYIQDMQAAGMKGAAWATGEWWGTSYALSAYIRSSGSSSLDAAKPQAAVMEKYPAQVGIQVNGGEFGAVYGSTKTSTFSNINRGSYNTNWHYDNQASFNYLASRGVREVVIPFRWERIQPKLGGALDSAEVTRLKDTIGRAGAAGIKVVPMVANYAAYWLHHKATNKGVRRAIGSKQVPISDFRNLWSRLSNELKNNANVSAYGLMREPAGLKGATIRDQAKVWEKASQAAVNAIRRNGDSEHLLVSGYRYSNTHTWPKQHPKKWITDSSNNHSYEAHHYWASTYDASYKSYDEEVAIAKSMGY